MTTQPLNSRNVLVVSVSIAISFIAAMALVVYAINVEARENSDVATSCVESGGTWIQSDKNCLRLGE